MAAGNFSSRLSSIIFLTVCVLIMISSAGMTPPWIVCTMRWQTTATLQAVVCQRMVHTIHGGVMPALEIMINTQTVRKMMEDNRLEKLPAAIETGLEDGMQTFNQALYNLVKERKITEKEAMAKATNPQALEMNFKGIFLDEARRILT